MESPIKIYRAMHGMTQAEFGNLVGVSQTMISLLENGERFVDPLDCSLYERVTAGQVTRYDLRPDVFGEAPEA